MPSTPVLAARCTTEAGPGGLSAWELTTDSEGRAIPHLTASRDLGDASWVTPVGSLLAVVGEHDSTLWLVRPGRSLDVLGQVELTGECPCHAAIDPTDRMLAVADYGSGQVEIVDIFDPTRPVVTLVVDLSAGEGLPGPDPVRQEAPHAHQVTWLDRAHLAVTDLGRDLVRFMRVSAAGLEETGFLTAPAGSGPRHLTVTRDGGKQLLTVCGELSGTVMTWSRQAGEGVWARDWRFVTEVRSSRTGATRLPGSGHHAVHPTSPVQPSGLVSDGDGRHYVANRRVGSIGVLAGRFGRLELVEEFDTTGPDPRDITVTTQGATRVWVALPGDDEVAVHRRGEDGWQLETTLDCRGAMRVLVGPTLG